MSSRRGKSGGSSREQKSEALQEKLQQLRSAVNSTAEDTDSIIVDASTYIEELKERVEKKDEDVRENAASSHHHFLPPPTVNVESVEGEKGFLINVVSENNCSGLLVCILEALEEVGLEVQDATVSCSHSFRLQAAVSHHKSGGGEEDEDEDRIEANVVEQVVLQAICNWSNI